MLPTFDPIVVSGGVLTNAPSPAHSLLMILDALQPTGIQRILLDINHLAPGLGAASSVVPGLVSQLILDPDCAAQSWLCDLTGGAAPRKVLLCCASGCSTKADTSPP